MTRNDEHTLNTALAESLRRRSPVWEASAEDLDALEGSARPDILVESPTGAPVIVETEFAPAHTVEQDAGGRLGKRAGKTGEEIEYAVALRAPQSLREAPPWHSSTASKKRPSVHGGNAPPRARSTERGMWRR